MLELAAHGFGLPTLSGLLEGDVKVYTLLRVIALSRRPPLSRVDLADLYDRG